MKKIFSIKIIFLFFLFNILIISISYNNNIKITDHIFSHRGASGEEVEHTYDAYDLAISYGSRYIEQDIVTSKNGTLYVSHDLSANRIAGIDELFINMTDDEIDNLETIDGQKILTLKNVFDKYKNSKIIFIIELKDMDSSVNSLIKLIKKYHYEKRVIVECFDDEVLKKIKKAIPIVKTLYLTNEQKNFEKGVKMSYIDIISVEKTYMNKKNCDLAHKNNKKFNVYTLNSINEIKKAIDLGVDNYFTNYTAKAILLEKKYRK